MSVKIGSNITSLNVQRNLGDATLQLSKSMEKLSSGLRINKASDDAAGLAISETLKSSSRVYTTAIRNVNDGISFLNIADSAMSELSNITTRNLELSEQSANGSYSKVQRKAMDAEADALVKEFNRIVKTTEFNGMKVIDVEESSGLVRIQAGYGVNGSLGLSVGSELSRYVGKGEYGSAVQYSTEGNKSNALQLVDIDGDQDLDMITVGTDGRATIRKNNGDGTFGAAVQYSTTEQSSNSIQFADIDGDGHPDMVVVGVSNMLRGQIVTRKNNGDGTFGAAVQYSAVQSGGFYALQLADIDNDGDLDMVAAGTSSSNNLGYAAIRKNNGDGTFGNAIFYTTEGQYSYALQLADIDDDGDLDMITSGRDSSFKGWATIRKNNGNGTFGNATQYTVVGWQASALQMADIDNDGDLGLVANGVGSSGGIATVRKNNGDGTFGADVQYTTEGTGGTSLQLADIDEDGDLDMLTAGLQDSHGTASVRKNNGDGTFAAAVQYLNEGTGSYALQLADVNGDEILDMVTAGSSGSAGFATTRLGIGHDVTTIALLNLRTQSDALAGITTLKAQLDRISAERGNIGSSQSRLSVALNTLGTTRENFDAAASRITDVDVAQESSEMTRNEIVQRVGAAILANANQSPELALKLLQ